MSDDVRFLILIDETGLKKEKKEVILKKFEQQIGMHLDEKYGTLALVGDLECLNNFSDKSIQFINDNQERGKLIPAILRDDAMTLDELGELYNNQLQRNFMAFKPDGWKWGIEGELSNILTYDINHKGGRASRRWWIMQQAGALKIFQSCYWIPKGRVTYIQNKFSTLVEESLENQRYDYKEDPITYHYQIFPCYFVGTRSNLNRWRNIQLGLFIEKIMSLYSRTKSKSHYIIIHENMWDAMDNEKARKSFNLIKKMKYWKKDAYRELEPYREAHYSRLKWHQSQGQADQRISGMLEIDGFDIDGKPVKIPEPYEVNIDDALEMLNTEIKHLIHSSEEFVRIHAFRFEDA